MKISLLFSIIFLVFGAILSLALTSCTYDNEESLYGAGVCDTTLLQYSDIKSILIDNCNSCHSVQSSVTNKPMDSYSALKPYLLDGSFQNSIHATNGYDQMPKDKPLSSCQLAKLDAWMSAGYPE